MGIQTIYMSTSHPQQALLRPLWICLLSSIWRYATAKTKASESIVAVHVVTGDVRWGHDADRVII